MILVSMSWLPIRQLPFAAGHFVAINLFAWYMHRFSSSPRYRLQFYKLHSPVPGFIFREAIFGYRVGCSQSICFYPGGINCKLGNKGRFYCSCTAFAQVDIFRGIAVAIRKAVYF
jgi:hypothetical protein